MNELMKSKRIRRRVKSIPIPFWMSCKGLYTFWMGSSPENPCKFRADNTVYFFTNFLRAAESLQQQQPALAVSERSAAGTVLTGPAAGPVTLMTGTRTDEALAFWQSAYRRSNDTRVDIHSASTANSWYRTHIHTCSHPSTAMIGKLLNDLYSSKVYSTNTAQGQQLMITPSSEWQ